MNWLKALFAKEETTEMSFGAKAFAKLRGDQIALGSITPAHLAEQFKGLYVQSVDRKAASLSAVSSDTSYAKVQPLYIPHALVANRLIFQMSRAALTTINNPYAEVAIFDAAGQRLMHQQITTGLENSGLKKYVIPELSLLPGQYYLVMFVADQNIQVHSTQSLSLAGVMPRTGSMTINSSRPYIPSTLNPSAIVDATTPQPWLSFSNE